MTYTDIAKAALAISHVPGVAGRLKSTKDGLKAARRELSDEIERLLLECFPGAELSGGILVMLQAYALSRLTQFRHRRNREGIEAARDLLEKIAWAMINDNRKDNDSVGAAFAVRPKWWKVKLRMHQIETGTDLNMPGFMTSKELKKFCGLDPNTDGSQFRRQLRKLGIVFAPDPQRRRKKGAKNSPGHRSGQRC